MTGFWVGGSHIVKFKHTVLKPVGACIVKHTGKAVFELYQSNKDKWLLEVWCFPPQSAVGEPSHLTVFKKKFCLDVYHP